MNDDLTLAQYNVLDYITKAVCERDEHPTFREIAEAIGLGLATTYTHCKALKDKGYIDFKAKKARTITVTGKKVEKISRLHTPKQVNVKVTKCEKCGMQFKDDPVRSPKRCSVCGGMLMAEVE